MSPVRVPTVAEEDAKRQRRRRRTPWPNGSACRARAEAGGSSARPVRDGRGPRGGPGGRRPPLDRRPAAGTGARRRLPGHAGGLRPRPGRRPAGLPLRGRPSRRRSPCQGGPPGEAAGAGARRRGGVPAGPCRRAARPRRDRPHRPRVGRSGGPWGAHRPPRPLLTTERSAEEGGRRRVRRHRAGPVPQALDDGDPVQDAGSGAADDLKKRLAFDAVTAARVSDLTAPARERPETPATGAFPEEDIDAGHPVGPHPNPRRPPPWTKKVRRAPGRLNRAIQVRDAPGKRRREWDDVQVWDFVRVCSIS